MVNTCKDRLCYLYIYTSFQMLCYNTDLSKSHIVTQAEVYTSLLLVVCHIVPCCRLCRFQQIAVLLKCIAWLIRVDFVWKKTEQSVIAKLWLSISVILAAHGEDAFVISKHWCGQSPTVLTRDVLNVESAFHQQMSSLPSLPRKCQHDCQQSRVAVHRQKSAGSPETQRWVRYDVHLPGDQSE